MKIEIQMKPVKQHFPVVLSIMLYKVVLTFESVETWNPKAVIYRVELSCGYWAK